MSSSTQLPFRARSVRVLIVSDHPETSDMYAIYLRSKGFAVATAAYEDAAAEAHGFRPDVIAADLGRPLEATLSVCRQFKEHPHTRGIPIVALTGYASERTDADAALAGCDSVLVKPVEPEAFFNVIGRILDLTTRSA